MGGRAPRVRAQTGTAVDRGAEHVVLAVDGDQAIGVWLIRALEGSGVALVCARDGPAALRLVADGRVRPDVLLTELELPGMNGVELAARLTAMRPQIRVVVMTGDAERASAARRHSSIVATVLLKPLDRDDVLTAVGALA
jgi:CheY-like chemotaxis protein